MRLILICVALTGALAFPAFAHTGTGQAISFASGIAHPLTGADHILAMVAVGLWAVLSRRSRGLGVADGLRGNDAGRFCGSNAWACRCLSWSPPSGRQSSF